MESSAVRLLARLGEGVAEEEEVRHSLVLRGALKPQLVATIGAIRAYSQRWFFQ